MNPTPDGRMRRDLTLSVLAFLSIPGVALAQNGAACAPDNAGLKLPTGFCATVFADSLAQPRRVAVAANGDVFVALNSGRGGGIVALRDASRSGRASSRTEFATGFRSSEVALFDGYLYTEAAPPAPQRGAPQAGPMPTTSILRYPLKAGEMTPSGPADTIVKNIPAFPGHSSRNFAISRDGSLYLNIGSATNNCQSPDRAKGVPGTNPCTELETRAGIWKFDARKTNQTPSASNHFARGIRNAVAITTNPADGRLWVAQHGRDDLASWFAKLGMDSVAAIKYNAENPAEALMQVNQGDDFGWPYCYYSFDEQKLVQAPEYGGDGKKVGDCGQKKQAAAMLPGHWAPNGVMFYTGSNFPARYKNGVFIAFHGSWNRAPEPQGGYNVVFQPLKDGKADGKFEVFADGFAPNAGTGRGGGGGARPTAVAQAADGSLYVVADAGGKIYKITYTGK
jgi:glucose/arabinose dehydrogenase